MRSLLIVIPGLLDWPKRVQENFSQTALKEQELTEIWALTVAMWRRLKSRSSYCATIVVF